jgi:hypothetical protein
VKALLSFNNDDDETQVCHGTRCGGLRRDGARCDEVRQEEIKKIFLQPRRAASMAAMSIFFIPIIAWKARFASSPPAASAPVSTRGVICHEIPHLSLHHPHWPAQTASVPQRSVIPPESGTTAAIRNLLRVLRQ